MSNFEEIFLPERLKKNEPKKQKTPVKKTRELSQPPTKSSKIAPKTDRKPTPSLSTQELQLKLDEVLNAIKQITPQSSELQQIGIIHSFNRKSLLKTIGRKGTRGTKLYELRDFFYPTSAEEIDAEIQKLKLEGLVVSNKNGWMRLSEEKKNKSESLV